MRDAGTLLSRADYLARFREEYPRSPLVDKLEAGQNFREPGYAPWEAAHQGEWGRAVRLAEAERPVLAGQYEDARARGARLRRVRVVQLPPSDYLLWEMSILRLRAELGEEIRVTLDAEPGPSQAKTARNTPPQRICRNSSSSGTSLSTSCGTPLTETSTARCATPIRS